MTVGFPTVKKRCKQLLKNLSQSLLYHAVRNRTHLSPARSVVFVCKGNVCRSAFAEYFMKATLDNPLLQIRSCGLDVRVRSAAPGTAISVARRKGLDLGDHLSKGIEQCDMESADLIIAMEFWHYRALATMYPHKKASIKLLREFAPFPENILCNIHDPFGQDETQFEHCFSQIQRAVSNICARMHPMETR